MFDIKKTSRDYVLIRINGEYSQHAHFKRKSGALKAIELIHIGIIPRNEYFRMAVKRLLTEDEFKRLKHYDCKPVYVNNYKRKVKR